MRTKITALFASTLFALGMLAAPAHAAAFTHCYLGDETGFGAHASGDSTTALNLKVVVHEATDYCNGVQATTVTYDFKYEGAYLMANYRPAAEILRADVDTADSLRHAAYYASHAGLSNGKPNVSIDPVGIVLLPASANLLADDIDAACGVQQAC